jgi:two-component system, OmpR family, response regulator
MRVLVVDDEDAIGRALESGLAAEGFDVDVVSDGEEGLWRARDCLYDAVVLDVMLPKMNGYRVCAELRAAEVWTPVLMLTAKDGEYDEAEALDIGADDYLTKPFSLVVLAARLRALIRRGAAERPNVMALGDLRLDPRTRECSRQGQRISLTPREFSLLHVFMASPGTVFSRAELLDRVWGFDFPGDPNTVEVYVGYLRKKIDVPFGRQSIVTVRGFGYRMSSA